MHNTRLARRQASAVRLDGAGILSWLHFGDLHIDEAFIVDATRKDQLVAGTVDIHAKVFDRARVVAATCCIDDGLPQRMSPIGTSVVCHVCRACSTARG